MSQATVKTPAAQRYLQRLCKHWSHSHETEFSAECGRIVFDGGRLARFEASDCELVIRVQALDVETLYRFQGTVARHLQRFALREQLGEPQWAEVTA